MNIYATICDVWYVEWKYDYLKEEIFWKFEYFTQNVKLMENFTKYCDIDTDIANAIDLCKLEYSQNLRCLDYLTQKKSDESQF